MSQHGHYSRLDLQELNKASAWPRTSAHIGAPRPISDARHLVHVFPNFGLGGAQVRFSQLAQSFGGSFRHTVVSLSGRFEAASLLGPDLKVELVKPPAGAVPLPRRLAAYRRALAELQPDLLLTYNWGAIEFACANRFGGAPHLHLEDGFGPEEATAQFARRIWARRLLLPSSQVIVPSRVLHRIAVDTWRLNPARVHYIPNGVAPRSTFDTSLASLRLGLSDDLPKIVWAGGLRAEKNPLRLLQAFAPLKHRATLLIVGDGPQRDAVTAAVDELGLADRVHLLGRRDDARDLIMQCEVLALSSDTEQMPLVVLEAMDAGLPIASVNVGDVAAMVAPENRPFIVEKSKEALTHALDRLVRAPRLRESVGAANRDRVRRTYSLVTMACAHRARIVSTLTSSGRAR